MFFLPLFFVDIYTQVAALLTQEIIDFVRAQKLGFVATVCPDGTPNLSPKGTTTVWDEHHLVFIDIQSPGTINNLLSNPSVEINIVDIFTRKGYRFKGKGKVLSEGKLFDDVLASYGDSVKKYTIKHVVLVEIEQVSPLWSPVYDTGASEEEVRKRWREYWGGV